ncbi:MAG: Mur ligase domain-containing protein, partial [Candidatus Omnitrophota bacterium]
MAKIKGILKGVECRSGVSCSNLDVKRISDDSRKIRHGDLFIAARGHTTDGHDFIGNAVQKGACVIISDRDFKAPGYIKKIIVKDARSAISVMADNFYGHPSKHLKMIGVTGTNGKTTVTYLIE